MVLVHLTTALEPALRAGDQGSPSVRQARHWLKGGAWDAESSSALVADPDRARARRAGRDGLGPLGSGGAGGGRAPASVPSAYEPWLLISTWTSGCIVCQTWR